MRKFEVTVEITKSYTIEVDDSKLTEEDLKAWESVFYDLDSADDKISSLALGYCESRARLGNVFIEGHGVVLEKGKKADGYFVKEDEVCNYMSMIKADDEESVDTHIKEL